ncbi:DUF5780 domain-containing protein [Brotaphodocola sp.]|uniref:DUF5780 domain-containing protein n=1 Tax=Brotaphodocola sp. TaxID=3073577 RepID=UPI003D7E2080
MICPKCQKEIPDDSLFCSGCGYEFKSEEKIADRKKKIKIFAVTVAGVVVVAFSGVLVNKQVQLNKTVGEFKELVEAENYDDARNYYEEHKTQVSFAKKADKYTKEQYQVAGTEEDSSKKIEIFNSALLPEDYVVQLEQEITEELEELQNFYQSEQIAYEEVKKKSSAYAKYQDDLISTKAKDVGDFCKGLKDSRSAYEAGIKSAEAKDYKHALENLSRVIEEDSNYDSAQAKMAEVVGLYKAEMMAYVDNEVAMNQYAVAISSLESLSKYCSDSDVTDRLSQVKSQKEAYDKEQERIKIENYKNNQQVTVTSARAYNDGYYIRMMRAEVKVKNHSNKTVKDVSFGLLLFDGNGYPVDVDWKIYQGTHSNEFNCAFNSANITAGSSYGGDKYYDVPDNCQKVKACVKDVTYTDGTTWKNPYYDYWLKDNYNAY